MWFDPLYILFALPGIALSLWAQYRVKHTFNRYARVGARSGITGAQAAAALVQARGVRGVRIEPTEGFLSDHYDPFHRVLRLSPDVYHGRSLAALGVAAHEAGHAIQHARSYKPLTFRSVLVKPATIGSNLGIILATVGLFMQAASLTMLGIVLFSAAVLFTLVTLPVEFDASKRAVVALRELGIVTSDESRGASAVLKAAALTYVAAALTAILQLLYFVMRAGLLGNRDD